MLRHTQKIREKYEEIQRKIFYMIPEKWSEVHLYASITDRLGNLQTGEMFFYYIPRGILKKKPINVYEIPSRFNIDEGDYLKLVDMLYKSIKELREEFRNSGQMLWSNITLSIKNVHFRIIFNYDNLQDNEYSNYERHIIWRYKYLNQGMESCNKEERAVLKKYLSEENKKEQKIKEEEYSTGIYIKNIRNIVDFETEDYESIQNVEYVSSRENKKRENQILHKNEI